MDKTNRKQLKHTKSRKNVAGQRNGTAQKKSEVVQRDKIDSYHDDILKHNSKSTFSVLSSRKSKPADPLELGYNADEELINSCKEQIIVQENIISQLTSKLERLECLYSVGNNLPEIISYQKENFELKSALDESRNVLKEQQRLILALRDDNEKLKLLHSVQRSISAQILSGLSDDRLQSLFGSEKVRKLLPESLRKLQLHLWSFADKDVTNNKVCSELVLSLRSQVKSLQATLTSNQQLWEDEIKELKEQVKLCKQENALDISRMETNLIRMQERDKECRKECQKLTAQYAALSRDMMLQESRHLHHRETLLRALAKLGGPERLRREIEELDLSASCLKETEDHVKATCKARELKLLSLQLQRELSEAESKLKLSEELCHQLQREKCLIQQGRDDALLAIKKQKNRLEQVQGLNDAREQRSTQHWRSQLSGYEADLTKIRADLKQLVHMIYKLTMWQSETYAAGEVPATPPSWLEGPRAITALARTIQSSIEDSRVRLAGCKKNLAKSSVN